MALTINNESKTNLSITNESKLGGATVTIDEMAIPIDEASGTIDSPGTPFRKESKNTLSITNENKS